MREANNPQVLDQRWRAIIHNLPVTDNMDEFLLIRFVIKYQRLIPELDAYPYIFAWEYPLHLKKSNHGKIDLVLWDGKKHAIVIEAKFLPRESGKAAQTKRTKKRGFVKKQEGKYMKLLKQKHPRLIVDSWHVTNEIFEERPGLCEIYKNFIQKQWAKIPALYHSNFKLKRPVPMGG